MQIARLMEYLNVCFEIDIGKAKGVYQPVNEITNKSIASLRDVIATAPNL